MSIRSWRCAAARELDRGPIRGALHGVPIGIKDVIDTADQPTEMGSPIYRGHRPACDAACVALLRAAGAVILGKTVTCEFAGMTAGPTTNPHNPAHTPGGSSSGSAAAVADLMLPAALGTQTGGSVLRPAAYCGVIGYKPTFGAFNRAGLKFAAESLDTIGLMARSLDDIELVTSVLLGGQPGAPVALGAAPAIGLCRTPLWDTAQPETKHAVEDAAARLAQAGAAVREVVLPADFAGLKTAARETINNYERSKSMAAEWASHARSDQPEAQALHRARHGDALPGLPGRDQARRKLPRAAAGRARRLRYPAGALRARARRPWASIRPATPASRRSGPSCTCRP